MLPTSVTEVVAGDPADSQRLRRFPSRALSDLSGVTDLPIRWEASFCGAQKKAHETFSLSYTEAAVSTAADPGGEER